MEYNLNDRATVTLTEKGQSIWREFWKDKGIIALTPLRS